MYLLKWLYNSLSQMINKSRTFYENFLNATLRSGTGVHSKIFFIKIWILDFERNVLTL